MHIPKIADDMSQQLTALRQQLLQARETEEVTAVLLPRMIENLLTPPPEAPVWRGPDPIAMTSGPQIMESVILHNKASAKFMEILRQQKPLPSLNLIAALLRAGAAILVSSDHTVSRIWLDMLLEAAEIVPVGIVRTEVLPIAVRQAQAWNNTWARISACHLFGKVCLRLDPQELQSEAVPGLVALCQDVSWEVRSAACDQLVHAASCFRTSPLLLSTLCELGADESETVLVSVVGATASSLQKMSTDTLVSAVTPLVMRLAREAAREGSPVLIALAAHYGDFCRGLRGFMTSEEKSWLVDMFQNMVRMGLPTVNDTVFAHFTNMLATDDNMVRWSQQIRTLAAASLPAVSHFLLSEDRRGVLLGIVRDLVFDPHPPVRSSLAAGLHKIVVALGAKNSWLLKYDFIRLLSDQNVDVIRALTPNVASVILLMREGGIFSPEDTSVEKLTPCAEVLQGLMTCEATVVATLDWRLYTDVIRQYEILHQCFPSDFIYNYVLSVMLQRIMTVRQLPSRCALARTILIFLRYNARSEQREDIRNRLAENLMKNKNSYHRMCYLRLSRNALDIFSSHYFKEWFFKNIITLSEDSVPTIRQVSAGLFPTMKKMCRIPEDKNLVDILDSAVSRLLDDSDREVLSVTRSVHHKLKEIEVMDNTEEEVDVSDEQRLEEEEAVEQRVPPDNFLHHGTSFNLTNSTSTTSESRTVNLQPTLNMTVSSQPTNMVNNIWNRPQTATTSLLVPDRPQQVTNVNQGRSRNTNSQQGFQGSDFVIDAGVALPEKQTSHIPSPRRLTNQVRHQNRRSWSGASNPRNRVQADYEPADGASQQRVTQVSSIDTGQVDMSRDKDVLGAAAVVHRTVPQAQSLLKNTKPTSIGRGTGEIASYVKAKLFPPRDNTSKPGTMSTYLPGSPVVMRPGRSRGGREIAHRNSVASIPFRPPAAENQNKSGSSESDETKAPIVRRRNVQSLGAKTLGDTKGTRILKRNSAIEFRLESSRAREPFTPRRSVTFERLTDFPSGKVLIRPQRRSLGIPISRQENTDKPSMSLTSSNAESKEKLPNKMDNIEDNGNTALFNTKDNSVQDKLTDLKSDDETQLVKGKAPGDTPVSNKNIYFEENISLTVNEPKVEFVRTDMLQQNERGESNETAVALNCVKGKDDENKNLQKPVEVELVQNNNPRREDVSNVSRIHDSEICVTSVHSMDEQGISDETNANNVIPKQNSEKGTVNYLQLETNSSHSQTGTKSATNSEQNHNVPQEENLESVGNGQQSLDMSVGTSSNMVTGEFKHEQELHRNHTLKNDAKVKNDSHNGSCFQGEKVGGTTKQTSRRSCNLDQFVTTRSSQQDTLFQVNDFPANNGQHSSSVAQSERRWASNRHSVGAVLVAPMPPRRHSSLDRLGGPRSDQGGDRTAAARVSSCHSSPTAGLPASRLPVLRRQHPP